jgi:hypothetical protein
VGKFGKFNGFLTFFTVLLIVTGAAFGQLKDGISISTGGGGIFVPVQGHFTDDDAKYYTGVGEPPKIDFTVEFTAADERTGGKLALDRDMADGTRVFSPGDLNVWIRPFGNKLLHFQIGKGGYGDGLGGVGSDSNTTKYAGDAAKGGGDVFDDDLGGDGVFIVYSKPITGLHLFARLAPGWKSHDGKDTKTEAKDVYKKIKAGLGYEIAGIGIARAQWVGNTMDGFADTDQKYSANNARIDAAFKLTAVKDLTVDFGVRLPIPVKEEYGSGDVIYQDNFKLGVAGEFKAGDFKINAGFYGAFGGSVAYPSTVLSEKDTLSPEFSIGVTPSFFLAALDSTVGADVGFKTKGESEYFGATVHPTDEGTTFGFGGWIKKNFGNSSVKTGLFYKFPTNGPNGTQGQTAIFTWPIIMELSF